MRIWFSLITLLFIASSSFAGVNAIEEEDGSPSVFPWKVKVSNGSLTNNGDGTASLSTGAGATPGGSDTQVQYNDGGAFGGDAGLTYNETTDALTVNGVLNTPASINFSNNTEGISSSGAGKIKLSLSGTNTESAIIQTSSTANRIQFDTDSGVDSWQFVQPKLFLESNMIKTSMGSPTPNIGFQNGTNNTAMRIYIAPNGAPSVSEPNAITALKLFGTDFDDDQVNYDDFGLYVSSTYNHINSKCNGSVACKPIAFTNMDSNHIMLIDTSSSTGNVGIGTITPVSKLEIEQSADSTNTTTPVMFDVDSVGAAGELTASSGTQIFSRIAPTVNQTSTAGYTALQINATETATGSGSKLLLDLKTGGSSKVVAQSDGNVGIGDTSPAALLTVGTSDALQVNSSGNLTTSGTILSSNTGSLGWSFVDGTDNTACTSQCTSAAVFGIANATGSAVTGIVGPSDATADSCICAGAS